MSDRSDNDERIFPWLLFIPLAAGSRHFHVLARSPGVVLFVHRSFPGFPCGLSQNPQAEVCGALSALQYTVSNFLGLFFSIACEHCRASCVLLVAHWSCATMNRRNNEFAFSRIV